MRKLPYYFYSILLFVSFELQAQTTNSDNYGQRELHITKIQIALNKGQIKKAKKLILEGFKRKIDIKHLTPYLGEVAFKEKRLTPTLKILKLVYRKRNFGAIYFFTRGQLILDFLVRHPKIKRFDYWLNESRKSLNRCLDFKPYQENCQTLLGQSYWFKKNYGQANAYFYQRPSSYSRLFRGYTLLQDGHLALGSYEILKVSEDQYQDLGYEGLTTNLIFKVGHDSNIAFGDGTSNTVNRTPKDGQVVVLNPSLSWNKHLGDKWLFDANIAVEYIEQLEDIYEDYTAQLTTLNFDLKKVLSARDITGLIFNIFDYQLKEEVAENTYEMGRYTQSYFISPFYQFHFPRFYIGVDLGLGRETNFRDNAEDYKVKQIGLSYAPYRINTYIAPTFKMTYALEDHDKERVLDQKAISLVFANSLILFKDHLFVVGLTYQTISFPNQEGKETSRTIFGRHSKLVSSKYNLNWINELNLTSSQNTTSDSYDVSKSTAFTGLSWSL